MNALMIGVLLLCIACMAYGYFNGFIKIVISLVAVVATVILVGMLVPKVTDVITEYTVLDEAIELKFTTTIFGDDVYLADSVEEELSLSEQITMIEEADVPDVLKDSVLDNNNSEIYEQLGVSTFSEYLGSYLAKWIINVISYIITFLVVWVVVNVFVFSLDVVADLPILHGINRVIGTVLGLGFAVVVIWVVFLGVTVMYSSDMGQLLYGWIRENVFLSFMYDVNPIMQMLL